MLDVVAETETHRYGLMQLPSGWVVLVSQDLSPLRDGIAVWPTPERYETEDEAMRALWEVVLDDNPSCILIP